MLGKCKRVFGLLGPGLLAGLIFTSLAWAAANPADDLKLPSVVARINGVDISSQFIKFKINNIVNQMKRRAGGVPKGLDRIKKIELARDVIDKEVIRELMYQAATAAHKEVDVAALEKEMAGLIKAMGGEEKFKKNLAKRNLEPKILRHDIEMEFLIRELIRDQIEGNVHINDDEIKKFYDDNINRFKRPESFHTRHILIPHFSKEDLRTVGKDDMGEKQKELSERSRKKAEKILADIRNGADFAALAKQYSKDVASANKGGDLDFMYKGIFPPAFDEAVAKLKPGEISDLVETPAGYHIIQLIETRPADTAPYDEVKKGIQKFLFMRNGKQRLETYVDKLRKQAKVEVLY
ncbi:MAG: peptidylprolyl isomerase [Nitrospinales bacterium]